MRVPEPPSQLVDSLAEMELLAFDHPAEIPEGRGSAAVKPEVEDEQEPVVVRRAWIWEAARLQDEAAATSQVADHVGRTGEDPVCKPQPASGEPEELRVKVPDDSSPLRPAPGAEGVRLPAALEELRPFHNALPAGDWPAPERMLG